MEHQQQHDNMVLGNLERAFNTFSALKPTHPDDLEVFRSAIHQAEGVMAMRQLRRQGADGWPDRSDVKSQEITSQLRSAW